jgi:hypothetical protein
MKYQRKMIGLAAALLSVIASPNYSLAQVTELPTNAGESEVYKGILGIGGKSNPLYLTNDGLIIDSYKKEVKSDGSVEVTMTIYNPFPINGKLNVYNSDGSINKELSKEVKGVPDVGKNLVDQGLKIGEEWYDVLRGKSGNFMDILKYPAGDPRTGIIGQSITVTLQPNQILELTNKDKESILEQKVEAFIKLAWAIGDNGGKIVMPDFTDAKDKKIFKEFLKELAYSELAPELLKDSLVTTVGKDVTINYELMKKLLSKFKDSWDNKKGGAEFAFDAVNSSVLSEGIGEILKSLGKGGGAVTIAADIVYGAASIIEPATKLYILDKLNKLPKNPSGLLIANNYGEVSYPISVMPIETFRPEITNGISALNSCITQYNTSHIGSAGCYFTNIKVADNPVQNEINKQRPENIQAKNTYTDGTIVKAPIDIGLTWNQSTLLDLDSHTVTPNGDHVFFSSRGSLTENPFTFLYRDSIPTGGTLGAEQTRITQFQDGTYRFYIYNYSDRDNIGTTGLSNSAAEVKIFQGGDPLTNIPNDPNVFDLSNPNLQRVGQPYPGQNTFNIPNGQQGNTWYVFKLDTRTGILNRVDRFSDIQGSTNVPNFK